MKKKLQILILCGSCISALSQNVQVFYDLGRARSGDVVPQKRNFFSLTYEMFKPDSFGYTYWFADVFFNSPDHFAGLGYTEIGSNIAIGKCPVQAHVEFNGGLYIDQPNDSSNYSAPIQNAWLAGVSWPVNFKNGAMFETQILYKYFPDARKKADAQLTLVWYLPMLKNKLAFSGFFDIWSEEKPLTFRDTPPFKKRAVIYTEPQLWYNVNDHLSIGSELRIGYNFVYNSTKLEIYPCMGAKWNF